jgi:hypothetical protein
MAVRPRIRLAVGLAAATTLGTLTANHAFATPPDDGLRTAAFFTGSVGKTGSFRGTLVCLSCDVNPGNVAREQCKREGHRHALKIGDDPLLHPLLATNEELLAQVNSAELHGKTVEVDGVYYPATGAILLAGVRSAR